MVADLFNKSDFSIPGLNATKSGVKLPAVKLLRKPRKPAPLEMYQPPPESAWSSPPPKSYISVESHDTRSHDPRSAQTRSTRGEPALDGTTGYHGLPLGHASFYNSTNSPQPTGSPVAVSPPPPSEYYSQRTTPTPSQQQQRPPSTKTPHSGGGGSGYGPPGLPIPRELLRKPRSRSYHSSTTVSRPRIRRSETKFVLDPNYRTKTSLGTYVEGQSLVRPYKARGPDPLPARPPRRQPDIIRVPYFDFNYEDEMEELQRYYQTPEFVLQDFLIQLSDAEQIPLERARNIMFSRHNYKKIQKLLFQHFIAPRKQIVLHSVELRPSDDMPHASPRIPQQQLLIEMASLVKEQMSAVMQTDMRTMIRPLPRYSPDYKPHSSNPHTEIVLYEDAVKDKKEQKQAERQNTELPGKENVFHASTAKYFQGAKRSNSPFAMNDENLISPTELAVLDALMAGGEALSLKAHFISQLPDIEPLTKTITYLNLSFNDFRVVPLEIFDIVQLTILKMRNNPIREIPTEISRLRHLKTLVFSFCLVSSLPLGLFALKKLEQLDFAYNKISFIPTEIRHLKKLVDLNAEGNQLPALPVGALKLKDLKHLRVRNNFMHPLFWRENTKNEPQRLQDISALACKNEQIDERVQELPENIEKILHSYIKCDVCKGPLYGMGLRLIRPVRKIYGIRNLPFLFRCCSPHCTKLFNSNSESLMEMLYGEEMGRHRGD